jgi:hypothetical protein
VLTLFDEALHRLAGVGMPALEGHGVLQQLSREGAGELVIEGGGPLELQLLAGLPIDAAVAPRVHTSALVAVAGEGHSLPRADLHSLRAHLRDDKRRGATRGREGRSVTLL